MPNVVLVVYIRTIWGGEQNYEEAVKWLRLAAIQGFGPAQNILGEMYDVSRSQGKEGSSNPMKAYEELAGEGDAGFQNILGYLYQRKNIHGYLYQDGEFIQYNTSVEPNYAKTVEWYELATAQGSAAAQNNLGDMYRKGLGVEPNYTKAVEFYKSAAARGSAAAQNNLGEMYEEGLGVEPNYAKAVEWYSKASTSGNGVAKNKLKTYFISSGSKVSTNVYYDFSKEIQFISNLKEDLEGLRYRYTFLQGYFNQDRFADSLAKFPYLEGIAAEIEKSITGYLDVLEKIEMPGFLVNCISVKPDYVHQLAELKVVLPVGGEYLSLVPSDIQQLLDTSGLINGISCLKGTYECIRVFGSKFGNDEYKALQQRLDDPQDSLGQYFTDLDQDLEFARQLSQSLVDLIVETTAYRNQLFLDKVWN